MIRVDVTIRRADAPVREASAWLLGGSEPGRWIEEIVRWRLPDDVQSAVTLYVLPRSAGVLVALASEAPLDVKPSGAAFGDLGRRLFLPVDAVLEPEVTLRDLEPLLRHDVSILHPAVGWIGYSREQALKLWDLIALPPVAPARWRSREPSAGLPWNRSVVSVSLAAPVSFEAFFEEEKQDIGSSSIDDIPPGPDEPREGLLQDLKRKAMEPIARGARALTRHIPGGAETPTWVDRLEGWANEKLRHVSDELERLRHKELRRLLDLLDSDAEQGLRHALPLGGGTHRGLAPAGGRLTPRSVDFELGALGGGRPLDPWDVPYEIQQKLLAKYRDLAQREKRLGRYRRAAYIYAELIGDLETAAAVLKEGRHFREAAEIYRRHLHKRLLAARTYEAGGFFREALDLYEELEMWEEVGDVYAEMGQPAKSRDAFRRARDQLIASRDRLGASRIVETKLDDVEQALEIVAAGWPDSRQASDCLERQLSIQAKRGFHDRTESLLKRLATESTPPNLLTSLVACLSSAASSYPNARLRLEAADLTRRKVAASLERAPREEAARLLESMYRLAPEDRLLKRDGSRFLGTKARRQPAPRRRRTAFPDPELVRSFELPSSVRWFEVKSTGSLFFALGHRRDELQLYRGNWGGGFEYVGWPLGQPAGDERDPVAPVTMELDPTGHRSVVLRHVFGRELSPKVFAASREVIEAETVAGDPGWLPRGTLALASLSQSWITLRYHADRLIISAYGVDGAHRADVADWTRPAEALHMTLGCQNQFIVVGQTWERWSGELLVFDVGQQPPLEERTTLLSPTRHTMRSAITGLRVAQPYTRSRVAVTMLEGVALHWLDSGETYVVASDLDEPSVSMLRNGMMIVVGGTTVRAYRTDEREPVLTTEMELPAHDRRVVDVVPGYAPNQFAVFTEEGQMLVYSLPSG